MFVEVNDFDVHGERIEAEPPHTARAKGIPWLGCDFTRRTNNQVGRLPYRHSGLFILPQGHALHRARSHAKEKLPGTTTSKPTKEIAPSNNLSSTKNAETVFRGSQALQ